MTHVAAFRRSFQAESHPAEFFLSHPPILTQSLFCQRSAVSIRRGPNCWDWSLRSEWLVSREVFNNPLKKGKMAARGLRDFSHIPPGKFV
jgi:hypothetical protein